MELINRFTLGVPPDEAWAVLTDATTVGRCLPGADLHERGPAADGYAGEFTVEVGPVAVTYRGRARVVERDDRAHRSVLRFEGTDAEGQGDASTTVTTTLEPVAAGTEVQVAAVLDVTGEIAELGEALVAAAGHRLVEEFASRLGAEVLVDRGPRPEPVPEPPPTVAAKAPKVFDQDGIVELFESYDAERKPFEDPPPPPPPRRAAVADLVPAAVLPNLRRLGTAAAAVLGLAAVLRRWRRRRHG